MEENKYLQYVNHGTDKKSRINCDKDNELNIKKRRRRHKRARAGAFISLIVVLGAAGFGIYTLINAYMDGRINIEIPFLQAKDNLTSELEQQEVVGTLEDLMGSEEEVVVLTPSQIEPELSEEEIYDAWLDEKIAAMPLEDKVLGLFIVRPEQITGVDNVVQAGEGTKTALEQYPVGGIVYSDSNIVSDDQLKDMLRNTREYSKYPIFLMLREECGNTVLGSKLGLADTRTASQIGATMDPYASYTDNKAIAEYLAAYGFDFQLGVVADVMRPFGSESGGDGESGAGSDNSTGNLQTIGDGLKPFMGDRSFGTDPVIVSRMVLEAVNAYRENNVSCALGYFPGQGGLTADPSTTITTTFDTSDDIYNLEYEIYRAGIEAGAAAVIVSHEYGDNLTGDNLPCSLSKDVYTGMLRERFSLADTVLITDCLDAATISEYYTSSEVCVKALKAGADMVMCPEDFEEGYTAVLEAVKSNVISEDRVNDSLKRVYRIKFRAQFEAEQSLSENTGA